MSGSKDPLQGQKDMESLLYIVKDVFVNHIQLCFVFLISYILSSFLPFV